MSSGPNPVTVLVSLIRSLLSVRRPGPFGSDTADHAAMTEPLRRLAADGPTVLRDLDPLLEPYLTKMAALDPNTLSRSEALGYWINLYNAGALLLAAEAQRKDSRSVLGVPGGFQRKVVSVAGESLSLDDIEHAKLRRFGDPRIHAALVCGSVSCPTLRGEPYNGESLDTQLDDQLRHFLAAGALERDKSREVAFLSRVFLWFGADFVRPKRMPTFIPARRPEVLKALRPWMDEETSQWVERAKPTVEFQRYRWGLSCTVR